MERRAGGVGFEASHPLLPSRHCFWFWGERKDRGVGVFLCLPAYHRPLSVGLGSDVECRRCEGGRCGLPGDVPHLCAPSCEEIRAAGWVLFHKTSRRLDLEWGVPGLLVPLTTLLMPSFSYFSLSSLSSGVGGLRPEASQEACCSCRLPASKGNIRLHFLGRP